MSSAEVAFAENEIRRVYGLEELLFDFYVSDQFEKKVAAISRLTKRNQRNDVREELLDVLEREKEDDHDNEYRHLLKDFAICIERTFPKVFLLVFGSLVSSMTFQLSQSNSKAEVETVVKSIEKAHNEDVFDDLLEDFEIDPRRNPNLLWKKITEIDLHVKRNFQKTQAASLNENIRTEIMAELERSRAEFPSSHHRPFFRDVEIRLERLFPVTICFSQAILLFFGFLMTWIVFSEREIKI